VNSGGGESVRDSESVRVVDEQTLVVAGGCGSGFILAHASFVPIREAGERCLLIRKVSCGPCVGGG